MISNDQQLNLRLPPQGVPDLKDAPADLVASCRTVCEAVRLCMNLAQQRYSEAWYAEQLGFRQGTFNFILNGGTPKRRRYLNPDLFEQIEVLAGNRAISQYFDLQSRGLLVRQRPERQARIAALRQELQELEAGARG